MLTVVATGYLTSIQDLGRPGYQRLGISPAGALDPFSLRAANALVGNAPGAAGLESVGAGLIVETDRNALVAVTGGGTRLTMNGEPRPRDMALFVRGGTILEFQGWARGSTTFLAIAGGIETTPVLGSRSTDLGAGLGGLEGRALAAGDRLPIGESRGDWQGRAGRMIPAGAAEYVWGEGALRVMAGPHLDFFPPEVRAAFYGDEYQVHAASSRMAYRLMGPRIERRAGEILSCGVTLGTIQVPPEGQPLVLMAERQTTGGYPILGCVIRADIPRLAQKRPGEAVRFRESTRQEGQAAYQELERLLAEF